MQKRIITYLLIFSISFSSFFWVPNAKAQLAVTDPGNTTGTFWNGVLNTFTSFSTTGDFATTLSEMALAVGATNMISAAKILALFAVQKSVQMIIGEGNGLIIRDYKNYLYIAPQQRAMAQMNSFFNTVSKGRISSLNYEGVGPNYDAYLRTQTLGMINGQNFQTNLQEQALSPGQMFGTGNMKGIMTYMQCANNPACYTLVATAKYNAEFAKAQEIAKAEASAGFMPKKVNGRITTPAALAQSMLTQIDQVGTQVIMNAAPNDTAPDLGVSTALWQIAQGSAMTIAARATNYGISDKEGKLAIQNKNDQFPFSLNYSLNSGVGFSAGGVTVSTGAGAVASQIQIGNTCATTYGSITPAGATVLIQGQKYTCPKTGTQTSGISPDANYAAPSITCIQNSDCTPGLIPTGYFVCNTQKRCVRP